MALSVGTIPPSSLDISDPNGPGVLFPPEAGILTDADVRGLEHELRDWDRHIDACERCLRDGPALCYEGEYLTEKVVEARVAARGERLRRPRGPWTPRLDRQTLPGVPA